LAIFFGGKDHILKGTRLFFSINSMNGITANVKNPLTSASMLKPKSFFYWQLFIEKATLRTKQGLLGAFFRQSLGTKRIHIEPPLKNFNSWSGN
jgi:hypothetical protein